MVVAGVIILLGAVAFSLGFAMFLYWLERKDKKNQPKYDVR